MRVHELAKEFGMSSKELIDRLTEMKIPAKNHASTLVEAYVDKIRKELGPEIAERQSAIETERLAQEAENASARAEEDARRKAEEESRRKAEDVERKAREADRKAREEEQRKLEDEARKRAEIEQVAREEAETADARAQIEVQAVVEPVPEPVVVVEESGPAVEVSPLEAAIAAESARLDAEKAAKLEKVEEERYRKMAVEAEQLQRDKVIEEAKAAVAAAQVEGSRKKKKKHKKTGEEAEEARLHEEATHVDLPSGGEAVTVTEGVTVADFADLLGVPGNDVIKRLFMLGTPLTVNQPMMRDIIEIIGEDMGREVRVVKPEEEMGWTFEDNDEDLVPRSPVVTVMGHVDHGKTSLLDAIRETGVADTEAGGITQHIGASVVYRNDRQITFIDTPGHEAFTAMRARGANITDIVILVVAADDGVMPQTVEAIHHAKAAGVPIIVAVNKIDKDGANPEQVKQMLTEHEIVPEEWGGTNIFVEVSAKQRINIEGLLEMVLLQADVLELRANPNTTASGVVIEAKLDKGRGPVATVLVQRGTMRVGDAIVAGTTFGRVRALIDPLGKNVVSAGPADPVEILGISTVPSAGDEFRVFTDERDARNLAEERALKQRLVAQAATKKHVSLDDLFERIAEGELAELNLVVKADVQGSIEALKDALDKMDQTDEREGKQQRLNHARIGLHPLLDHAQHGVSCLRVLSKDSAEAHLGTFSLDDDHDALARLMRPDRRDDLCEVRHLHAIDADDAITGLHPGTRCCRVGEGHLDASRLLHVSERGEHEGEHKDSRQEIEHDPGREHRYALPRGQRAVCHAASTAEQCRWVRSLRGLEARAVAIVITFNRLQRIPVRERDQESLSVLDVDEQLR
jgi:translation initiation factor IF-2